MTDSFSQTSLAPTSHHRGFSHRLEADLSAPVFLPSKVLVRLSRKKSPGESNFFWTSSFLLMLPSWTCRMFQFQAGAAGLQAWATVHERLGQIWGAGGRRSRWATQTCSHGGLQPQQGCSWRLSQRDPFGCAPLKGGTGLENVECETAQQEASEGFPLVWAVRWSPLEVCPQAAAINALRQKKKKENKKKKKKLYRVHFLLFAVFPEWLSKRS